MKYQAPLRLHFPEKTDHHQRHPLPHPQFHLYPFKIKEIEVKLLVEKGKNN